MIIEVRRKRGCDCGDLRPAKPFPIRIQVDGGHIIFPDSALHIRVEQSMRADLPEERKGMGRTEKCRNIAPVMCGFRSLPPIEELRRGLLEDRLGIRGRWRRGRVIFARIYWTLFLNDCDVGVKNGCGGKN